MSSELSQKSLNRSYEKSRNYLKSQFEKKYVQNDENLKTKEEIKESLQDLKLQLGGFYTIGKIMFWFFFVFFSLMFSAMLMEYLSEGLYESAVKIIIILGIMILVYKFVGPFFSNKSPTHNFSAKESKSIDGIVEDFIRSENYKDVFDVYKIIFREKNLFTKDEISRFIDNEVDLFNATFESLRKDFSAYLDKSIFRELVLTWSDLYINEKIEEIFNNIPHDELLVVEKYISTFGQFKEYSDAVQVTLGLSFNLDSALDRKFDGTKSQKNESLLKDILAKGSYGKNQIAVTDLDFMDGIEFENFLSVLFRKMGYKTEVTKASGDQGVDLILEDIHFKYAVQAKRYSDKVSNSAIQEVFSGMKFYNCNKAMVVTTNFFTPSAVALAQKNGVELFDRNKLNELLLKHVIFQSDFKVVELEEDDLS